MWENLIKILNQFGERFIDEFKTKLDDEDVNATYTLSNSVSYYIEFEGNTFEVSINLKEYWKYVENGRKAGKWPPLNAIKDWVMKKPIIPRPMNNGKLPTLNQLAFLIQRKIGMEGIEARPLFQMTFQEVMDEFDERIYDAIEQDILESLNS